VTAISRTANFTVTISEAMEEATITGAAIQLRDPGGAVFPAVVSYSAATRRATLNPDPTLAADRVWSFATR